MLDKVLQELIIELKLRLPKLQALYQFGSSLDYKLEECQDLDIAALIDGKVDEREWWDLQESLSLLVGKKLDLIQLRTVSTVFQNEIFSKARRLYSVDDDLCSDYEALNLSLYQKLSEERAEIIEEIQKSKRVYDI